MHLITLRGNICRKANKKSPDKQTPRLHIHSVQDFFALWVPICPIHVFYSIHCSTWLIHSCLGNIIVLTNTLPVQYNFYVQKCFDAALQIDGTNWLTCIHLPNTEVVFPKMLPFAAFSAFRLRFDCSSRNNSRSSNCNHIFQQCASLINFHLISLWHPQLQQMLSSCSVLSKSQTWQ